MHHHQQPEVNYLPRFSPHLISLERYTLRVYRAGEFDLLGELDIVHIRLLVVLLPRISEGRVTRVTKFVPHQAPMSIASSKLTFEERAVLHRVYLTQSAFDVVLKKSIPTQICPRIIYVGNVF